LHAAIARAGDVTVWWGIPISRVQRRIFFSQGGTINARCS
jgi:hypothetical protein